MEGSELEEVSSWQKMWELEGPCCGSGPCFVCKRGSECAASHTGRIFFWMLCCSPCEMLFWLKEEEMSHQELTQRLTTVITHVGKHLYLSTHYICVDLGALFPEEVLMLCIGRKLLCDSITPVSEIGMDCKTHRFGQLYVADGFVLYSRVQLSEMQK